MPDPDPDDVTALPEGVTVIAAEDSDDETADQGGGEPTDEMLTELLDIAWTAAAEYEVIEKFEPA